MALAFVGYNTIFALSSPEIDMAAHLGGLAGGFVYGLLLTGATPVQSPGSAWLAPALKRLAVLAACLLILAASWPRVSEFARSRILADPVLGPTMTAQLDAQEAWNKFYTAAEPVLEDFDRSGARFNERLAAAKRGETSETDFRLFIVGFHRDSLGLEAKIKALPAGNDEIRQMRQRLESAQASLREMLEIMVPVLGMRKVIDGPKEFSAASENYAKETESFRALVDDYFRAYSLGRQEKKVRPDAQTRGKERTGGGR